LSREVVVRKSVTLALLVLVVASAASGCATPQPEPRWHEPGTLEVPLATSWPPTVRVTLEGEKATQSVRLMLDTGAEEAALDDRIVERLALGSTWRLNSVQGFDESQGGVGRRTVFQREVKSVTVGDACRIEKLRIVPLPMPRNREGVLGLASFPGRALVIDPVRSRVSFVPRAKVAELASQEGAVSLPVRREGNLLMATVELRGNKGPHVIEAVLDTGASDSFLTEEALAGMKEQKPASEEAWYKVRLGSVNAGGHMFRIEHGGNFCTLGADVLLKLGRPVLFDLEDAKVILLPGGQS
jgi:hypothetical protein